MFWWVQVLEMKRPRDLLHALLCLLPEKLPLLNCGMVASHCPRAIEARVPVKFIQAIGEGSLGTSQHAEDDQDASRSHPRLTLTADGKRVEHLSSTPDLNTLATGACQTYKHTLSMPRDEGDLRPLLF